MLGAGQLEVPLTHSESKQQEEGPITTLPDELILLILSHLDNKDLILSVANVCLKWRLLSADPQLWRSRSIFYNAFEQLEFIQNIQFVKGQINFLHLGGHQAIDEVGSQALLSSEINSVQKLNFLSSCRTAPSKVLQILKKFCKTVESLALCLNDELVSFGEDGQTCYAITDARPGLLFDVLGHMENVKHLKLYGGFSTKWYFGELGRSPGCRKLETLDLKDFTEFYQKMRHHPRLSLIETLVTMNKSHLKSVKLSFMCAENKNVKKCVLESQGALKELLVNVTQIKGFVEEFKYLSSLHLGGRFLDERSKDLIDFDYLKTTDLMHNLKEINLLEFSDFSDIIIQQITESCYSLQVFRLEGNMIANEDISTFFKALPLLKKLCIRDTDMTAEGHLVYLELHCGSLEPFDFEKVCALDCKKSEVLKEISSVQKLKVFQSGCNCKNFGSCCESQSVQEPPLSHLQNCALNIAVNPDQFKLTQTCDKHIALWETSQVKQVLISNKLKHEYISKFNDLLEDDINFHFHL